MKWILIVVGGLIALVVVAFVLLLINAIRATRNQDRARRALLAPVLDPLSAGREPDPAVVRQLAMSLSTRSGLCDALASRNRLDLVPPEFRTRAAYAESYLAHWLAHPNELQVIPDQMQLVETITIPTETDLGPIDYMVFRFRVNQPHWAADRGWMVGVCGPLDSDPAAPLFVPPVTLSELEPFGTKTPQDHAHDFHKRGVEMNGLNELRQQRAAVS